MEVTQQNQTATLSILHEQSVNIHKRLTKALFSRNSVLLGHCHGKTHMATERRHANVRMEGTHEFKWREGNGHLKLMALSFSPKV